MRSVINLITVAAVGVLVGSVVTDVAAQSGGPDGRGFVLPTWGVLPDEAAALIEKGDVLVGNQAYGEAREYYEDAAVLIRADDGFPSLPLRRIAESYYFEGRYQTSIAALDALAEEAAEFGDVLTQAWARADAAWVLWVDCERKDRPVHNPEMARRATQLRRLLASPYLPVEDAEQIWVKRCGGCHPGEEFARKPIAGR